MVGVVLSGKDLSAEVREGLKKQVEELKNNDPKFKAGLVIVQVRNFATKVIEDYLRKKIFRLLALNNFT